MRVYIAYKEYRFVFDIDTQRPQFTRDWMLLNCCKARGLCHLWYIKYWISKYKWLKNFDKLSARPVVWFLIVWIAKCSLFMKDVSNSHGKEFTLSIVFCISVCRETQLCIISRKEDAKWVPTFVFKGKMCNTLQTLYIHSKVNLIKKEKKLDNKR